MRYCNQIASALGAALFSLVASTPASAMTFSITETIDLTSTAPFLITSGFGFFTPSFAPFTPQVGDTIDYTLTFTNGTIKLPGGFSYELITDLRPLNSGACPNNSSSTLLTGVTGTLSSPNPSLALTGSCGRATGIGDFGALSNVQFSGFDTVLTINSYDFVDGIDPSHLIGALAFSQILIDALTPGGPSPQIIVSGSVPEPSTYLLLGSGLAGMMLWRKRTAQKTSEELCPK